MKKITWPFYILLVFFVLVSSVSADTFSDQPVETSSIDAFTYELNQTNNYENTLFICAGEKNDAVNASCKGVIKFDLSSIPASATVSDAKLYLYIHSDYSSVGNSFQVYYLLSSFVESEITYLKRNASTNWNEAGIGAGDQNFSQIASTSFTSAETAGTEKIFDLSDAVIQDFVDGDLVNNGFVFYSSGMLNDAYYFHSAGASNSALRPKLVVTYSIVATNTPTQTFTATLTFTPSNTPTNTATSTATATATSTGTLTPTNTYVPTDTNTPTPTSLTPATSTFTFTPTSTATPGLNYTPVAVGTAFTNLFTYSIPVVYGFENGVIQVSEGISLGLLLISSIMIAVALMALSRITRR